MNTITYKLQFTRTPEFTRDDDDFVVVDSVVPVCIVKFDHEYFELNSGDPDRDDDHRMNAMIAHVEYLFTIDPMTHCVMQIDKRTVMIVPYRK